MVPLQGLSFEHDGYHECEDCQRYHFLDDLELHDVERTAVVYEAYLVGGHLGDVFKEGYSP